MSGVTARTISWRRIFGHLTSAFTIIALVAAIVLVSLRLAGFQIFTVLSGSMEPVYSIGSLIYVKPVDVNILHEGDVITFMNDADTTVTHRIVEVVTEPDATGAEVLKFRTKGDANNAADGRLVHYKNVVGVPVTSIPLLGYASNYLQRPPGIYIAIMVCTFLVSLVIIPYVANFKGKESVARERQS